MKQIFEILWNSSPLQLVGYLIMSVGVLLFIELVIIWMVNKHD